MRKNSEIVNIENREKIIRLLENPLVTGYEMEMMSNGQLHSANFQRYKYRVKQEVNRMLLSNIEGFYNRNQSIAQFIIYLHGSLKNWQKMM